MRSELTSKASTNNDENAQKKKSAYSFEMHP